MTQFVGADLTATYTAAQLIGAEAGKVPKLGNVYESYDGKRYKFVLFDNGAGNVASVAGNFAYVLAVSGASAGQITTVTMDLSDSAGVGAGVFQSVIADGSYGWIQTWGPATLTTALTAGADGNTLTPVGSSDGTLDVVALVTDHQCAVAIDASAKLVFVTCP
jgi:hypothetical protein